MKLSSEFKTEIDRLENSSEWDRFCMVFFGETNAGKECQKAREETLDLITRALDVWGV